MLALTRNGNYDALKRPRPKCKNPKSCIRAGLAAGCGHTFCRTCLTEYIAAASGSAACPACDRPLTVDLSAAPVRPCTDVVFRVRIRV